MLGLGFWHRLGGPSVYAASMANIISWLLSFNLNGTATVGDSVTDGYTGTDARYPRVFDQSAGLVLSSVVGPAFISEGMRVSWDTDEGAIKGAERVTSTTDMTSTWTETGVTAATNSITEDSSTGVHRIAETISVTFDVMYGVEVVASLGNGTRNLGIKPISKSESNKYGVFDLSAGTSSEGGTTGTLFKDITDLGGGRYRCRVWMKSGITSGTSAVAISLLDGSTESYSGDGSSSINIESVNSFVITPAFLNSVSSSDSTKLHPTHNYTDADGNTREAYSLYNYWATGQSISIGDKRYYAGTDNHNYALTATTAGTTSGTLSVAKTDIGSTVSDGAVTWSVDSFYSNLATSTTNYLPHVLSEVLATNQCADSRTFNGTGWLLSGTGGITKDQTGVDGTANSATTLTDTDSGVNTQRYFDTSITSGQPQIARFHVGKTSSATSFPAVGIREVNGTARLAFFTVDTDNGSLTAFSANSGTNSATIKSFNANFWEVTVKLTGETGTSLRTGVYPSVNTDASGTWVASTTGSAVFDQVDTITNSSTVGTPIVTSGGTVTRPATSYTVSPSPIPTGNHQGRLRWIYGGDGSTDVDEYLVDERFGASDRFYIYYNYGLGAIYSTQIDSSGTRSAAVVKSVDAGGVYNVGWSLVDGELNVSIDGTPDASPATGVGTRTQNTSVSICSSYSSTSQTSITDVQVNTDVTTDFPGWRDDTTWSQP